MSIIRVRKDAKYFTASNEPFNDKRISWETRGLMGYLLSKPDNWEIRMGDLLKQGPAGEYKLRRMLAEARKFGYMNRIRITLPDHTFEWLTEIYESPDQNPLKNASGGFSTSGLSTGGASTSGKPRDILRTDSISTERIKTESSSADADFGKAAHYFESNICMLTPALADRLGDAWDHYPHDWLFSAIDEAVTHSARSWAYVDTCLKNWQKNGRTAPKKHSEPISEYRGL